jgi:hypothetical protein
MIRDNHDRTKMGEKRTKHEGTVHERRERVRERRMETRWAV